MFLFTENTKDLSKKNKIKKLKKLIRRNIEKRVDNRGVNKASIEERRDKYFMKGPRVKHVCRSASIVLGQPMATFPISSTTVSSNYHIDFIATVSALASCMLLFPAYCHL